ncbi:glycosyltransferase [Rubripirellula amarantea]|nr:glycosyltransferase [Rubripirellula amarantea]
MIWLTIAIIALVLSLIAVGNCWANLPQFIVDLTHDESASTSVSVLIPARDEEAGIHASVTAALASENIDVEVIVMDDQSTDRTAEVVKNLVDVDPRVRYAQGKPLPDRWNGKQHACYQLSLLASNDRLVFMDADVRLEPDAIAKLVTYQDTHQAKLLSAFPHQETGTWLEKWIIPMMYYILLCYLPMGRMRRSTSPAFASGCGQLFVTRKSDYELAGTHRAIRGSRHDGIKLPRAYREAGLSTDVIDGTNLAKCRMYRNAREVVRGALKNATEGIASTRLIVPFSVLLIGGSVLPLIVMSSAALNRPAFLVASAAAFLGHLPRAWVCKNFRQSGWGLVFHSASVLVFVGLQWLALLQSWVGVRVMWRGRD